MRYKPKSRKRVSKHSVKNSVIWFVVSICAVFSLLFVLPQFLTPKSFCANSISCIKDLSGSFQSNENTGEFLGHSIQVPQLYPQDRYISSVLGDSNAPKVIKVDLTNQRLYAYEGNQMVYNFLISSGKWGKTPTGTFAIWIKLRYTRMVGGSGATYYNLPNVPYTMFFYNDQIAKSQGFSIHGAYWHNNFGHPMSHGCVNMRPDEAEQIFNWALPVSDGFTTYASADSPGTTVIIYGQAPKS